MSTGTPSRAGGPPAARPSPAAGFRPDGDHHALPVHEVVLLVGTDARQGLSRDEAHDRLQRFGPNRLPEGTSAGALVRLLRQFHNPLIYVLLASAGVTLALGEHVDTSVILGVVLVNAATGFVQESRAEAALASLRALVRTRARVVRDGSQEMVDSEVLVPGDLVVLEAGDMVPADLRLLGFTELHADESALTGESVPVAKDEAVLPASTVVSDRRNMVYSGTLVTNGTGTGVVVATGTDTELGEIHRLVGSAEVLATPLTRKLAWFSKLLTVVIVALAAVTFAVGVLRGEAPAQMFTAAVALAVGAIPEGLPAAVTITLAIGVRRMASRRAVIRRLPAVETLGSTSVICSDKTGTMTENQMTVQAIWIPAGELEVTGTGYDPSGEVRRPDGSVVRADDDPVLRWTALAGAVCNDAYLRREDRGWKVSGDPTEAALLVAATKAGLDLDALRDELPRVADLPFSSARQYMATLHRRPDGSDHVLLVKGAVERLVDLCGGALGADGDVVPLDRDGVLAAADALAARGLRVLATAVAAHHPSDGLDEDTLPGTPLLTGLLAMHDPPRPAVADAVAACHRAGVKVKMITGDHAVTAATIARRLGIVGEQAAGPDGQVVTGVELDAVPEADYPNTVERVAVFARMSPEQKLRLVQALQSRDHIVAMTGDGVNDAPALRQADIGIAMGRHGTEVAKDSADMVLLDDDFTTIERAVEEGRGVFDNITKFIAWTLPTNMGEGFVILIAVLAGLSLPILPVQILWINMTTAVLLGLMLAFEPKEAGVMTRPPRPTRQPLLTGVLMARVLLVSALLVGGSLWLFQWQLDRGASLAEARTTAANFFVAVEILYLFSCRSLTRPSWRLGLFSNPWIWVGVSLQVLGQLALTYLPAMNRWFGTAPLDPLTWARLLGLAVLAALVVAVAKRLVRPA